MRVVGCIIDFNEQFLLLLRDPAKPQGGMWGLPAGKVDDGETDLEAMIRELQEETGYAADPSELTLLGEDEFLAHDDDDMPFIFTTFILKLARPIEIKLRKDEHTDFGWTSVEDIDKIPNLITDLEQLLYLVGYID